AAGADDGAAHLVAVARHRVAVRPRRCRPARAADVAGGVARGRRARLPARTGIAGRQVSRREASLPIRSVSFCSQRVGCAPGSPLPSSGDEESHMWLMTPLGFFSIVCKPDDKGRGTLTIRARVKSDLEALRREFLPALGPIVE